jgi:hypothetical protein
MNRVTSPFWLNLVVKFGEDGKGQDIAKIAHDMVVISLGLIILPGISYENLLKLLYGGGCRITFGETIFFETTQNGIIPTVFFSEKPPQSMEIIAPEQNENEYWPSWMGMKLCSVWRLAKGVEVMLEMDGPPGAHAGIALYGEIVYSEEEVKTMKLKPMEVDENGS